MKVGLVVERIQGVRYGLMQGLVGGTEVDAETSEVNLKC